MADALFLQATAGSVASCSSMALMYPLDRLKIVLQVNAGADQQETTLNILRRFYEKEGIRGYYRGLTPIVQTVAISQFVYFYIFEGLKKLCPKGAMSLLLASSVAGILNMAATEPLWKASVQLQSGQHDSRNSTLSEQMRSLIKIDGISSLWSGFPLSIWLTSNPVIQFFAYDSLKAALKRTNLSNFEAFFLGMIAKGIATTLTYPLQIAQAKLRTKDSEHTSMTECLKSIYDHAGISGLFTGLLPKMTQASLTAAFMFLFYERIVRILRALRRVK